MVIYIYKFRQKYFILYGGRMVVEKFRINRNFRAIAQTIELEYLLANVTSQIEIIRYSL